MLEINMYLLATADRKRRRSLVKLEYFDEYLYSCYEDNYYYVLRDTPFLTNVFEEGHYYLYNTISHGVAGAFDDDTFMKHAKRVVIEAKASSLEEIKKQLQEKDTIYLKPINPWIVERKEKIEKAFGWKFRDEEFGCLIVCNEYKELEEFLPMIIDGNYEKYYKKVDDKYVFHT